MTVTREVAACRSTTGFPSIWRTLRRSERRLWDRSRVVSFGGRALIERRALAVRRRAVRWVELQRESMWSMWLWERSRRVRAGGNASAGTDPEKLLCERSMSTRQGRTLVLRWSACGEGGEESVVGWNEEMVERSEAKAKEGHD